MEIKKKKVMKRTIEKYKTVKIISPPLTGLNCSKYRVYS